MRSPTPSDATPSTRPIFHCEGFSLALATLPTSSQTDIPPWPLTRGPRRTEGPPSLRSQLQ